MQHNIKGTVKFDVDFDVEAESEEEATKEANNIINDHYHLNCDDSISLSESVEVELDADKYVKITEGQLEYILARGMGYAWNEARETFKMSYITEDIR